jgi:hypothetical protein
MGVATAGPAVVSSSPRGGSGDAEGASVARRRPRSSLKPVAWVAKDDIDHGEWEAQGRWLGSISRCSQWWVGDWVRFGAAKYGEKYAQAAELTGYDEHSLRNMAYVASRYAELSRRRDNLSFSHHAELAALQAAERDEWLERAEREKLSVSALRTVLRRERLARGGVTGEAEQAGKPTSGDEALVVCPNCGHEIVVASADGNTSAKLVSAAA